MSETIFTLLRQIYFISFVGLIGLIIGSFLNVVALSLLAGESLARPRSMCPKCHSQIAWYDNLPVLSYLLLKAKCRHCKCHISIQYPLVEASTSLMFIFLFLSFGFSFKFLFLMFLMASLIIITITDLKEQLIYDAVSMPIIPIGFVYSFFDLGNTGLGFINSIPLIGSIHLSFVYSLLGAIAGFLVFEVLARLGKIFVGERAFGEGDSVLAAGIGAWLGVDNLLLVVLLSFIFQVLVGIPIIVINMYKEKDYKSICYTSLMLFSLCIPYLSRISHVSDSTIGALITMLVSLSLAVIGAIAIIEGAKKRQSFTFIPFGPALIFGAIIALFFGQTLIQSYTSLF